MKNKFRTPKRTRSPERRLTQVGMPFAYRVKTRGKMQDPRTVLNTYNAQASDMNKIHPTKGFTGRRKR